MGKQFECLFSVAM